MPLVVIQTAKTADLIESRSKMAAMQIVNKIGIRNMGVVTDKDLKQFTELLEKNKKPVEFTIDFDGKWFTYGVRIGAFKQALKEINLAEDRSIADKEKVMNNLIMLGAATKKQLEQLKERNQI